MAAEIIKRNVSWTFEQKKDPILEITNNTDSPITVSVRLLFGVDTYRYPSDLDVPSGENRYVRIREVVNDIASRYDAVKYRSTGVLQIEFEGAESDVRAQIINFNPRSGLASEKGDNAPVIKALEPKSGDPSGGTIVTITGEHFSQGASVKFGGLPAMRSRQSDTALIAVAPAHAEGAVDVEVRNGRKTSVWRSAFRYESAGPKITGVTPDTGSTKGGFRVTIQGSNFVPGSVIEWNGAPLAARYSNSETISILAPSGTTGLVPIRVINPDKRNFVLPDAFAYKGLPRISSLTPDMGTTGGGYSVTVYGSNFDSGCSILFGKQYGQTTFINSGALAAIVPAGQSGSVDISVANKEGDQDTVNAGFLYNDPPRILNIEATPNPIVRNTTSTITVNATDPEAAPLSYDYRVAQGPSGGIITGQGARATYKSPNTTGTAVIQVTVYDEHRATAQSNIEIEVE